MSIEQISQIVSICAAALTIVAILIAGLAVFIRLIIKARKPDSDGGKKITPDEWQEIFIALVPFGVKVLKALEERTETEQAAKKAVKEREEKIELDDRGLKKEK